MIFKKFTFVIFILAPIQHCSAARNYITGNGFRDCADFIVEEDSSSFTPELVPDNSIIYVETGSLEYFFLQLFPKIKSSIILVSHNGDWSAPGRFAQYLNDSKIIKWFGQNCDIQPHPKFCPIPIGIANQKWEHGNQQIFDIVLNSLASKKRFNKSSKMYINFAPGTNPVRPYLLDFFKDQSFVNIAPVEPLMNYLTKMAQYRFVLSPFGNGLDCHRTWEALLVDCIPVVKTSTLDPLYEDLPVIIVQDWQEITEEFLETKYEEIQTKKIHKEKLFLDYWIKKIKSYKF